VQFQYNPGIICVATGFPIEVLTMADSRTINIDGIGSILLEHSPRAKQTIVSVKPKTGIVVTVPIKVSFEEAIEFVNRNTPWISKTLANIQQLERHQKELAELFSNIAQPKAQKALTARLQALAKKHGFTYGKLSIRDHKTKWGSCSHKNTISLNTKLVALPKELMDYVILRELVHTRIHTNSTRFWAELDKHLSNSKGKIMASRLREYGENIL
jgi:predicted metal-dependent hydrolase